jgi:hypothetical protein
MTSILEIRVDHRQGLLTLVVRVELKAKVDEVVLRGLDKAGIRVLAKVTIKANHPIVKVHRKVPIVGSNM